MSSKLSKKKKNSINQRRRSRSKANQSMINRVSVAKEQVALNKDLNTNINYYIDYINTYLPKANEKSKEKVLNNVEREYNNLIYRIYSENNGNTLTQIKVINNLEQLRLLILIEKIKLIPNVPDVSLYRGNPPPPPHPSLLVPYGKTFNYDKKTSLSNFIKELQYILKVNSKNKSLVILPSHIWSNIGITIYKNMKRNKICISKLITEFSNTKSQCYKSFPIANSMSNNDKKISIKHLLNVFNSNACIGDPGGGGLAEFTQHYQYYELNKPNTIENILKLPTPPSGGLPNVINSDRHKIKPIKTIRHSAIRV